MTSETLFKKLGALDAPRPPSAARLAAEAFFAVPTAAAEEAVTPVIVRRREALADDGEIAPETPSGSQPRDVQETRAPRVFRVDSPAPAAVAPVAEAAEPEAEPSLRPIGDTVPANPPVRRLPRKKARRLHGEVTIIRPAPSATPQGAAADMPAEAQPQVAAPADHGIEPASPRAQRRRPEPDMEQSDDAWPRYPQLMARIRALEAEAKVLKAREAAEAIEWIKRAISTHGLTAQDLGFVDHRDGQAMASGPAGLFGVARPGRRRSR